MTSGAALVRKPPPGSIFDGLRWLDAQLSAGSAHSDFSNMTFETVLAWVLPNP